MERIRNFGTSAIIFVCHRCPYLKFISNGLWVVWMIQLQQATLQVDTYGKHCWPFLPPDFKIYLVLSLMLIWRVFTFLLFVWLIRHNGRYISMSISAGNILFRTSHDKLGQLHCASQTVARFFFFFFFILVNERWLLEFTLDNVSINPYLTFKINPCLKRLFMSLLELKVQLHWSPCFWNQLGQSVCPSNSVPGVPKLLLYISGDKKHWNCNIFLVVQELWKTWSHVWKAWIASVTFICMDQGLRFCNWTNGNGIHVQ